MRRAPQKAATRCGHLSSRRSPQSLSAPSIISSSGPTIQESPRLAGLKTGLFAPACGRTRSQWRPRCLLAAGTVGICSRLEDQVTRRVVAWIQGGATTPIPAQAQRGSISPHSCLSLPTRLLPVRPHSSQANNVRTRQQGPARECRLVEMVLGAAAVKTTRRPGVAVRRRTRWQPGRMPPKTVKVFA